MKKITIIIGLFLLALPAVSSAEITKLDIYTLGSASGSYHRSNVLIKTLLEQEGIEVNEIKVMDNCKNFNAIYDKIDAPSIYLTDGLYQGLPNNICDTPVLTDNFISQRALAVFLLCGQGKGVDEFIDASNSIKVAFTKSMPATKITSSWGEHLGKKIIPVKYNSSGEISAALANGEVEYALTWTMHGLISMRDNNLNCFAHTGPEDLIALDGVSKVPSYKNTALKQMPFMAMSVYSWYEGKNIDDTKSLRKVMKKVLNTAEWKAHSKKARYFQVDDRKAFSWAKNNKDFWTELQN